MAKEFKIEDGVIYEREIERVNIGNCPFCGEPVWVSEGQQYPIRRKWSIFEKKWMEDPIHKKCARREKRNARK